MWLTTAVWGDAAIGPGCERAAGRQTASSVGTEVCHILAIAGGGGKGLPMRICH